MDDGGYTNEAAKTNYLATIIVTNDAPYLS